MWRGLTFLLPFLFFGHVSPAHLCPPALLPLPRHWALFPERSLCSPQFWQLFNALTLFQLAQDPQCKEWQVSLALGWGAQLAGPALAPTP